MSLINCQVNLIITWSARCFIIESPMMMVMNCFCGMVDRRKVISLISSLDHCQRFSPSRISDTPRAGFEPVQNLSSDLVEKTCANFTSRSKINKWFKKSFCPQEFPVPPKSYEGCKKGIVTKGVFKILSSNIDEAFCENS